MDSADVTVGYRRSTGSRRGEARRRDLLERVTDDLAVNGLVDFSLRRAARSAGTTHKVLLYYFDGVEDLLKQAVFQLRGRLIDNALAGTGSSDRQTLAGRVRAIWPVLMGEDNGLRRVLEMRQPWCPASGVRFSSRLSFLVRWVVRLGPTPAGVVAAGAVAAFA
jgi:AcrR family transcriptional regulator